MQAHCKVSLQAALGHLLPVDTFFLQVNPYSLTTTLVEHAQQQGAKLIEGTVTGLDLDDAKKVKGVHVNGQTVPAAIVVLCMGPWTDIGEYAQEQHLIHLPRVQGLKAHSLIYSPTLPKDAPGPPEHCLFTSFGYKSEEQRRLLGSQNSEVFWVKAYIFASMLLQQTLVRHQSNQLAFLAGKEAEPEIYPRPGETNKQMKFFAILLHLLGCCAAP
eukprot:1157478-Pelagomonas_calceolata.AAC.9